MGSGYSILHHPSGSLPCTLASKRLYDSVVRKHALVCLTQHFPNIVNHSLVLKDIIHCCPLALVFYKTHAWNLCKKSVKEAGLSAFESQVCDLTSVCKKGWRDRLVAGDRMRVWLPWKCKESYLLEKQHKETINQSLWLIRNMGEKCQKYEK